MTGGMDGIQRSHSSGQLASQNREQTVHLISGANGDDEPRCISDQGVVSDERILGLDEVHSFNKIALLVYIFALSVFSLL